jgi:hypothetical protein
MLFSSLNHPKWNEQRTGLRISISDDMGARASKVYTLVGEEEDIVMQGGLHSSFLPLAT